ncbi:MAG: Rrf2 family transcriptional regulator [Candidatus Zixiibacteriota bacterium]
MFNLTKKVEYALIGLAHIAAQPPGAIITVREVAERYRIPGKLLAKVFHEMKSADLLRSHQGKNGGYSLAQSPTQISLATIIGVLEGHADFVICCDGGGYQCPQFVGCNIQSPLEQLNRQMRGFLGSVTLTDFISNRAQTPPSGN